jgi:hypothetical protein
VDQEDVVVDDDLHVNDGTEMDQERCPENDTEGNGGDVVQEGL